MMTACEGSITFPVSIYVKPDVLGKVFEGRTAEGDSFEVFFPTVTDVNHENMQGEIRPAAITRETQRSWVMQIVAWGRKEALTAEGEVFAYAVESITFAAQLENHHPLYEQANVIGRRLDGWFRTVFAWLELWTGKPFQREQSEELETRGHIWETSEQGGVSGWGGGFRVDIGRKPVTLMMMASAVRRANEGLQVPDQWRLLTRARGWRDGRIQVIDAATAVEMAIERRIFEELSARTELAEEELDTIIRMASGVVEKLQLLETLVPPTKSMRKAVADRIARPRNRAVHAGYLPTREESARVLRRPRSS